MSPQGAPRPERAWDLGLFQFLSWQNSRNMSQVYLLNRTRYSNGVLIRADGTRYVKKSGWQTSSFMICVIMPTILLCRVRFYIMVHQSVKCPISYSLIKSARHNQRLLRNSKSSSSGRNRFNFTFLCATLLRACSFSFISACRYTWVVSTFSCPSHRAITVRSTP